MLQVIIIFIMSASLLFADVVQNNPEEDTVDTTKITEMPYGFYKEQMEGGTYKVVDREDLSQYPLKRIFSGYGTFDIEEKNCKYVENSDNKLTFKNDFEKINVYNNDTFAISRQRMTYGECVALTAKYIGTVYAPKDAVENSAISRGYYLDDEAWVGLSRPSCTEDYLNEYGVKQNYENFMYENEPCDENKRYVYKPEGTTAWMRSSSDVLRKCVVRIETNDYTKPIKICAPWWRIESTFLNKNKQTLIWGGKEIDLSNFLMPDVPQRVTMCTQRSVPDENETVDLNATKKIYCKRYYSRKAGNGNSGECLEEPIQPACEINECAGYIEHNCKKLELLPTFKDYNWGYIVKNGEQVRVKIDDKIKTFVYECPANNPNTNDCVKREDIIVFPKECPTSQCDNLRMCIQSNEHTADWCKEQYPCEKIYGDNRYTPVYNDDGSIKALRGKCQLTGEVIENDQIRKTSYSKTDCVEYAEINEEEKNVKKCISVKEKVTHSLDTTINEADIYQYDAECIRTNNIEDARPYVDAVFDYLNRGFFTTVIEKAYISGEQNDTVHAPDIVNSLPYQIPNLKSQVFIAGQDSNTTTTTVPTSGPTQEQCSEWFGPSWADSRLGVLFADENSTSVPVGVIQRTNPAAPFEIASVVMAYDCNVAADEVNQTNITQGISYDDYPFAALGIDSNAELRLEEPGMKKYCVLGSHSINGDDIIKQIVIDSSLGKVNMTTLDLQVNQEQCQNYVSCLGLNMTSTYADATEVKPCTMNDDDVLPPINFEPKDAVYQDFVETEGSIATTLDGTKDMIVIQEYAPGRFGYFSNHRFQLPKNNIVKLNNREIFPLVSNAAILEPLDYHFDVYVRKETVKNKEPTYFEPYFETLSFGALFPGTAADAGNNFGAAVVGGAVAGITAALAGMTALASTGIGLLVVVIILFFAGNKRYGNLRTHWDIKKTLNGNTEYVKNPYDYEFRLYDPLTRIFTYEYTKYQTGMLERGDIEKTVQEYATLKRQSLYFAGYSKEQIEQTLLRPCEANFGCIPYPKSIKWYKFSGKNVNEKTDKGTIKIDKRVNTIYMGAVNTVTIFVPYRGDYEIVALDKNKNVLAKSIVTDSDFVDMGVAKHPFAKVMFSMSPEFKLAEGMEDGNDDKACRHDNFAEWGGGVSGVYYEETTPDGHKCSKSKDDYVKENSAMFIRFKAVDADKYFEVKLKGPMPFANRFYFVHLGLLEKRTYECYKEKEPCEP